MCGLRVPRDASNEVRLCEGPLAALEYRKYIPHSPSRWSVTTLRQRSVPICQRDQSFRGSPPPYIPPGKYLDGALNCDAEIGDAGLLLGRPQKTQGSHEKHMTMVALKIELRIAIRVGGRRANIE